MKMHFNELFEIKDGRICPKFSISFGGVTMSPGVAFGAGVSTSGVDLFKHTDSYFYVEVKKGVHVIKEIYK